MFGTWDGKILLPPAQITTRVVFGNIGSRKGNLGACQGGQDTGHPFI